jgi:hypothetical protein
MKNWTQLSTKSRKCGVVLAEPLLIDSFADHHCGGDSSCDASLPRETEIVVVQCLMNSASLIALGPLKGLTLVLIL